MSLADSVEFPRPVGQRCFVEIRQQVDLDLLSARRGWLCHTPCTVRHRVTACTSTDFWHNAVFA